MPPKKKKDSKKKKSKKPKGEESFVSEEVRQLQDGLRLMKAEIWNEKKLLNDFQCQKEKIEKFWTLEKKKRDDLKMMFRNKLRQKQDVEEKHSFELKVYKKKVKHLLHEQQSHMTEVRFDTETALKLVQDGHRGDQHELDKNNRAIKVARKDMELAHIDLTNSIKQRHEQNIMKLRKEYERRAEDLKSIYDKKMTTARYTMDEKRKDDVAKIEQRKNAHIAMLMSKHKKAFDDIKNYYRDITHANLDLIKTLKEEVGDMKKKEQGVQKEVNEISRINKRLSKPLARNKKLVEDLKKKLEQYQIDLVELDGTKARLVTVEEAIKNLEWEKEITEQKYSKLDEETKELQQRLEDTVYSIQQKTGFKNLLLEKKLEAMSQDLEKTESALAEVLASTNLNPAVIGDIKHNLEDVLMAKNKQVQKLEDALQDLRQKYQRTIRLYETKLGQHSIPIEELGFTPLVH